MEVTKDGEALPVEVKGGTPVLPNEICLKLIDEIERSKGAKVKSIKTEAAEEDFELTNIWPQLSKVINWLVKNQFKKAMELMRLVICRRRKEIEDEEAKVEEQMKLMLEQVKGRKEAEIKKVLIEACCGEESKLASHFKQKGGESIRLYLPKTTQPMRSKGPSAACKKKDSK